MKKTPKVNVIMSTYNGEKFVKQQIDSILNQKGVDVTLHIYDDVSTDNTVDILKQIESKNNNVHIHINKYNKNFTYNFIDALFEFKDNEDFDYYSFADQDDVWMDDKLITGIRSIEKSRKNSTLYSSNLKLVDVDLKDLNRAYRSELYKPKKHDELRSNIVTGCTMIFDNECKNVFTRHYPKNVKYHDHWFALIANYVSGCNYIYDSDSSHILYRQHSNNISGGCKKVGFFTRLRQRLGKRPTYFNKLKQFLQYYSDSIAKEDRVIIEKFIEYKKIKNKMYLLKHFKTTNPVRFKIGIITNKFIEKEV